MMLSVSPGYHITLDYPFGVSNVYDVVCVSRLSITLDYPFCVL